MPVTTPLPMHYLHALVLCWCNWVSAQEARQERQRHMKPHSLLLYWQQQHHQATARDQGPLPCFWQRTAVT